MQDIAGLRAVIPSLAMLRRIDEAYEKHSRFSHELRGKADYISSPKEDGYRSIHLIYRYKNPRATEYDGLHVELQLRTRLQHAWATAVETVDIFANQAIKAGQASLLWGEFFQLASAAFAQVEKCPVPAQFRAHSIERIREQLFESERKLNVLVRLRGFSVAADKIQQKGRSSAAYHLVVLDTSRRVLTIRSFTAGDLDAATDAYAEAEIRTAKGEPIDAVLVAGGGIEQLRKTYPNYFLDASIFIDRVSRICRMVRSRRNANIHKRAK